MSDALEAKVKEIEKRLVEQNATLQKRVTTLEDIESIQKLERAYAFYLEHLMADDMADLWAKDGVLEWRGQGRFIGQDTIRKLWHITKAEFAKNGKFIHPGPRYHGLITVSPDGKTAEGRWYVAGALHGMEMLCENRYVKEDGVWKFSLLSVGAFPRNMMGEIGGAPSRGVKPPDEAEMEKTTLEYSNKFPFSERLPRTPRQEHQNYIHPFSFKHPVTGKNVNKEVEAWNKAHPVPMPPGGEKWTAPKK